MPQNRVHDIVVDNERDDPHLTLTPRAYQRVHRINTFDELCPTSAEGTGVRAAIPGDSSRGSLLAIGRRGTDVVSDPAQEPAARLEVDHGHGVGAISSNPVGAAATVEWV